jgi:hypothetical protein
MKPNSFSGRLPFLLLPRNEAFVRGDVPYPAIKDRAGIALMLLLLLTFVILAGTMVYQQYVAEQLARNGKMTTANIVNRVSSSGKYTTYTLEYEYQAETVTYHQSQTVSSTTYDKFPEGSKVTIAYLPDNPTVSQLAGPDADSNYLSGQIIAVILPLFIALGGLIYFVWPVVKDRKLAKGGSIIKGQIVERRGEMISGKRRYYELTVTYSFVSPLDGTTVQRTQSLPRNDLKPEGNLSRNVNLPAPGAAIAVLYLDNEHYKML